MTKKLIKLAKLNKTNNLFFISPKNQLGSYLKSKLNGKKAL